MTDQAEVSQTSSVTGESRHLSCLCFFPDGDLHPGGSLSSQPDLIQRLHSRERERNRSIQRQRSRDRDARRTLSFDATPFYMPSDNSGGSGGRGSGATGGGSNSNESPPESGDTSISQYRRQLGERLYPKVHALQPVSTVQFIRGEWGCIFLCVRRMVSDL